MKPQGGNSADDIILGLQFSFSNRMWFKGMYLHHLVPPPAGAALGSLLAGLLGTERGTLPLLWSSPLLSQVLCVSVWGLGLLRVPPLPQQMEPLSLGQGVFLSLPPLPLALAAEWLTVP